MVSSAMGGGYGHGGYGYGPREQHVYLHHVDQPAVVTVDGTPIVVQQQQPAAPGVVHQPGLHGHGVVAATANVGGSSDSSPAIPNTPLAPLPPIPNVDGTIPDANNNTEATTQLTPQSGDNNSQPTDTFEPYPTIHPSLLTYAGGTEDIFFWAKSIDKNLTVTSANDKKDKTE